MTCDGKFGSWEMTIHGFSDDLTARLVMSDKTVHRGHKMTYHISAMTKTMTAQCQHCTTFTRHRCTERRILSVKAASPVTSQNRHHMLQSDDTKQTQCSILSRIKANTSQCGAFREKIEQTGPHSQCHSSEGQR